MGRVQIYRNHRRVPGSGGEVNGEETVNRDKYDDKKEIQGVSEVRK